LNGILLWSLMMVTLLHSRLYVQCVVWVKFCCCLLLKKHCCILWNLILILLLNISYNINTITVFFFHLSVFRNVEQSENWNLLSQTLRTQTFDHRLTITLWLRYTVLKRIPKNVIWPKDQSFLFDSNENQKGK
jgi:hypothetical protein